MIQTSCPHCGNQLTFQPQHAGLEGQCDACNGLLIVPAPNQYARHYAPGNAPPPPPPPRARPNNPGPPSPLDSLADMTNPQQPPQDNYAGNYDNAGYNNTYGGGYNQPPAYYTPYPQNQTNGLGLASFILSLVGFSLISLILGLIALKKQPKGFAIAGVIISSISIVITIIVVIVLLSVPHAMFRP